MLMNTVDGQIFNPSDAKAVLKLHNDYRKLESASDMYRMYWNVSLQQRADSWAKKCLFKHELNFDLGENLYFDTDHANEVYLRGMKAWHNERSMWSHSTAPCKGTCHFTQIIWAYTTTVGCSTHLCHKLNAAGRIVNDATMFVCYYYPRGNFIGQWPFARGQPCSDCAPGDSCLDNLCVSSGPESKRAPALVKMLNPKTPLQLTTDISSLEAFRSLGQDFSQTHRVSQHTSHSHDSQTYHHKTLSSSSSSSSSSSYTQLSHSTEEKGQTQSHRVTHSSHRQIHAYQQEREWVQQAKGQSTTDVHLPEKNSDQVARSMDNKRGPHTYTRVERRRHMDEQHRQDIRHRVTGEGQGEENSVSISTSSVETSGMKVVSKQDQESALRELHNQRHYSGTSVRDIKKSNRPPHQRPTHLTTPNAEVKNDGHYNGYDNNYVLQRDGVVCADRHAECHSWATKCYRSAMVTLTCPLTCSKCAKNLTNVKADQVIKSSYHKVKKRPQMYHKPIKSRKNEAEEQRTNGQRHKEKLYWDQSYSESRNGDQRKSTTEQWEAAGDMAPMELKSPPLVESHFNSQMSRPVETSTSQTRTVNKRRRKNRNHNQARPEMCRDDPKHITSCRYWSKKGFCKENQLIKTLYCRWSCASCG